MKKPYVFLFLCISSFLVAGCVPLIVGGAVGALGGYAVSKDTIQGDSDKSYGSLWDSAVSVAKIRGKITQTNETGDSVEFETDSGHVWVRLIRVTRATTRVRVSARRYHLPNLGLAEEVFVKIMEGAR